MAVRPGEHVDPADRIRRTVSGLEPKLAAAFLLAVRTINSQTTLAQLAALLEAGRMEEALVGLQAAAELLGTAYGTALADAGAQASVFLSRALTVAVAFDVSNVNAVAAIQSNRLRLISGFTADQRATVRQVMTDAIARGLNPREQARLFRDSIGLTARQGRAVENYRRLLEAGDRDALRRLLRDRRFDRSVERAIREGTSLTAAQVDRMVDRYRSRSLKHRAEVIARTEALRAAHEGTEEMFAQAIQEGQLEPRQLLRTWVTARDERVRGSHRPLNGQKRPMGEPWQAAGGTLRFPGDPSAPASETIQCRCVLTTRVRP